ncbi:MAG: cation transporter [Myxococcota bacterium]
MRVVAALEGVSGVKSATADFASQSATVKAKGTLCEPEGTPELVLALRNIGYDGEVTDIK